MIAEACPRCGYDQVVRDQCPRCLVVISKYIAEIGADEAPSAADVPAGFWVRAAASFFDNAFLLAVGLTAIFISRLLWGPLVETSPVLRASLTAFHITFGACYYVLLHWVYGQTIGKMLLDVKVVALDGGPLSLGRSALRWIGYLFSFLPFLLGYVMAGIRPDKRALHDLIARTRVIRIQPGVVRGALDAGPVRL